MPIISSLREVSSVEIQPITEAIWREKYRYADENSIDETFTRVVNGICKTTSDADASLTALLERRMVPGGRVIAGAGTGKRVTLINCFVSPEIQDSVSTEPGQPGLGIMDTLRVAAVTQQMGGGIGMDFSPVRPAGAVVKRTGSVSSGVLPFMDMWHAMCGTIMSSGSRRGAMMATLGIWHPDVLDFVKAKHTKNRLTNFNVSVLVTDAFMEAVAADADWDLYSTVPRADGVHVDMYNTSLSRVDGTDIDFNTCSDFGHFVPSGETRYIYCRIKARELWDQIIEGTYVYAEPGVVFIDRVNHLNNLWYCEKISAVNPCGEQFLPPNGDCNLGHVNLAVMVKDPFTPEARFDYDTLRQSARTMVRFLDNVLDVSLFPTEEQRAEAQSKRRIGLGFTGLANALQMVRVRYGSPMAVEITRQITRELCLAVYDESVNLAVERGPFPLFDADQYLAGNFVQRLPDQLRDRIRKHGIRNGVLLTVAPTGTTSILVGNVSSGIEPVIALEAKRKVLQDDGSYKTFDVLDYGYLKYLEHVGGAPSIDLPDFIDCTVADLTVDDHLGMQAAAQEWIDSAISKTVNCPESMTFGEFKGVYARAYELGLKGCTTFRPDPRSGRGQVITARSDEAPSAPAAAPQPAHLAPVEKVPMQEVAEGRRYRIKWPHADSAFYVMITDYLDGVGQRRPFEIFIMTKSAQHDEWMKALAVLITAIFRRGGDVSFIVDELKQVYSPSGGVFHGGRYINSLVAAIGYKIDEHLQWLGLVKSADHKVDQFSALAALAALPVEVNISEIEKHLTSELLTTRPGGYVVVPEIRERCARCNAPSIIHQEGCRKCTSCGASDCG